MALEIMLNEGQKFRHHLRDDFESVFYVLIWIACHMVQPEVERKDPQALPIREWCNMNKSLRRLGLIKLGHMADFEDSVLKHFTPYWDDFKPFVRQLLLAFWPDNKYRDPSVITAEKMVSILKDAVSVVREPEDGNTDNFEIPIIGEPEPEDDTSDGEVIQSYVVLANSKRNRLGQDVAMVTKRARVGALKDVAAIGVDIGAWGESVMVKDPNSKLFSST